MSLSLNSLRRIAVAGIVAAALSASVALADDFAPEGQMMPGMSQGMPQGQPFPNGNMGFTGQGMPRGMNPNMGRGMPQNMAGSFAGPNGGNPAELGGGSTLEQAWNAAARTAAMARQMGGTQGNPGMAGQGLNPNQGMNPQMMAQRGQNPNLRPSQGNQFAAANFGINGPNGPMGPGGNPNMSGMQPRGNGPMGGGMPNGMGQMPQGMGNGQMGGPMGSQMGNPNMGGRGPMNPNQMNPNLQNPQFQGGVDLVLEDVELAGEATVVAGPAYTIRFRNQGLQGAGKFVVLLGASPDGRLAQETPKTVIEVPGIEAGKGIEVTLRLPKTAEARELSRIIVMVDAKNSLEEMDKSNNGAVLDRASLGGPQGGGPEVGPATNPASNPAATPNFGDTLSQALGQALGQAAQ